MRSIAYTIKCLAGSILDPSIKNPLPSLREKAEDIYQEFISSEKGKDAYKAAEKEFPKALPCRTEDILAKLTDEIKEAAEKDPNKFQILRAYIRDKIFDGLL